MSCNCSGTSSAAASASPSIASQLDALSLALFGTPTKTVVDGRVVWTNVCAASLPFVIAGVTPEEGEGLLCYLIRALKAIPGAILPGILTFVDATERAATAPQYVGQLGTQQDTNELFIATGIVAGDWSSAPPTAGIKVFSDTTERNATFPAFIGQIGSQTDTNEVYVATGLGAGDWILASAGNSGAFSQNSFTGTGAQTAFTLSQDPGSIVNTWVFIDGVYQNKTTSYGVSGTTLTFTAAPASGAEIQVIVGTMSVTSIVPDDSSVSTGKVIDRAITGPKIALASILPEHMTAGAVVQIQHAAFSTLVSTTAAIPVDDTIPTNSEGTALFSKSITPFSATNKILVRLVIPLLNASAASGVIFSVFRGSTCIGILAHQVLSANYYSSASLEIYDSPASVSSQTYSVRFGNAAGSTSYVNGYTTRYFGGVAAATLTLTEVVA